MDNSRIFKIARLVARAHQGQTRDGGEPFVRHPFNVARRVAERYRYELDTIGLESMVIVALTHDIIEDAERKHWVAIRRLFTPQETSGVHTLTKWDEFQDSFGETTGGYDNYIDALTAAPRWVRAVKAEDRLDNLNDAELHWDVGRYRRYIVRTGMDIYPLTHDLPGARQEMKSLLRRASNRMDK